MSVDIYPQELVFRASSNVIRLSRFRTLIQYRGCAEFFAGFLYSMPASGPGATAVAFGAYYVIRALM